jgi:hypothetical protein
MILAAMSLCALAACSTMSADRRSDARSTGDNASMTQNSAAAVPEERVVHTGIPEDSTQTNADSSSTQTATNAAAAPPDSAQENRDQAQTQSARTVQVTCPEPSGAQAGQCFTRVLYPPQFTETQVQEVVRPEYEKITYTEPVYEDRQEQVLVREAYTREVDVPALYDTFYEQVMEKPAGKVWKKGRGAIERVDPQTGEIYCLVDQPPVYRTVERKELKRPAGKRVEQVPAEYTTRTVRKLVTPPQQVRTTVPAEYATVTKKQIAQGDSCEYVQVLCQDNATQSKIHEVEQALQARGYQVDNDGLDDEDLADALRAFQSDQGLPQTGIMTARTLEVLGVSLEPAQQPSATSAPDAGDTETGVRQ